jgi:hypothetical protein
MRVGKIERAVVAFARKPNGGLLVTASPSALTHRDTKVTEGVVTIPLNPPTRRHAIFRDLMAGQTGQIGRKKRGSARKPRRIGKTPDDKRASLPAGLEVVDRRIAPFF